MMLDTTQSTAQDTRPAAGPGRGPRLGCAVPLTDTAQPRLWAEVRTVADDVGVRAPHEIHLTAKAALTTAHGRGRRGFGRGHERLLLGAPLLVALSTDQLRRAVAHALGPGRARPGVPEVALVARAWTLFLEEYAGAGLAAGRRPAQVLHGFHRFLAVQAPSLGLGPVPSAEDTAAGLLTDVPTVLRQVEDEMYLGSDLETLSWERLLGDVAEAAARAEAARLIGPAESPGLGARTLWEALDRLGRGLTRELTIGVLPPEADSEEVRETAIRLVTAAVSCALVDHCGATFQPGWGLAPRLVDRDGDAVDVAALVRPTYRAPRAAAALDAALTAEGVPRSLRLGGAAGDPGPRMVAQRRPPGDALADEAAGSADGSGLGSDAALGATRFGRSVVVVLDAGLVVRQMPLGAAFRRSPAADLEVLRTVARTPWAVLRTDPRCRVVPWETVRAAACARRGRGHHLLLSIADGSLDLRLRTRAGDLPQALRSRLGDRLVVA